MTKVRRSLDRHGQLTRTWRTSPTRSRELPDLSDQLRSQLPAGQRLSGPRRLGPGQELDRGRCGDVPHHLRQDSRRADQACAGGRTCPAHHRREPVPQHDVLLGCRTTSIGCTWPASQVKWKDNASGQDMHQKSLVLHGRQMAIFGSSNWTASSSDTQREHNYFTQKPWFVRLVRRSVQPQVEQPDDRRHRHFAADVPGLRAGLPGNARLLEPGQRRARPGRSVTLRWEGGWWAHKYDIYFGTTSTPPLAVSGLHARVGDGWRVVDQGVVHVHRPPAGRHLLLAHRRQDDGEQDQERARPIASRRLAAPRHSRGADRADGGCHVGDQRRSGLDRCRRRRGLQDRAQALRAARRGRRLAPRRPTSRPTSTPTAG